MIKDQHNTQNNRQTRTYEEEVLSVLAFEFSISDYAESERKIKRRLRDKKLGPYDLDRIDSLRRFKNQVQKELGKFHRSKFWIGSSNKYADMEDWDFYALLRHMENENPAVPKQVIGGFLPYAIYLYYMR